MSGGTLGSTSVAMMSDDELEDHYEDERDDGARYAPISSIDMWAIPKALTSLALFDDDPYLRLQTVNLAVVDKFISDLEKRTLRRLIDEERTPTDDAMFLGAQSQMWIFAAYEIQRTWRQRMTDIIKWHECGGLGQKIASLEKDDGFQHFGKQARAHTLRKVQADSNIIQTIRDDLKRTYIAFTRLEFLRVFIAKHEISGKPNGIAMSPGYGRINMWCGSLDYEMNNGRYIMYNINRRDIADEIRAIPSLDLPTDDNIASFKAFMKGPPNA
ncbi:hypothetical protein BH10PLA2_BH10PLA2_01070 [soil metagenome]